MVYIEKIVVKGRPYYKLVHTIRKGKKVIHKSKYLGKALPTEERLERLKKEFLRELTGSGYKYLTRQEVAEIEQQKKEYQQELTTLSPLEKEKNKQEFIIRFTYDSSKLSGVIVTLRQTALILKEGIIPKDIQNLKTVKALENHQKGAMIITKYAGTLDLKFMKKLHLTLLSGVDDAIAGKLRDELQRNVKIAGTAYVPPKWQELKKEFPQFFLWYKAEQRRLHPLELAALVHLKIISIQPFVDGNSRLSRLLMNWILWKKNYPPIAIPIEDLENYYDVLDKYQIENDERPFVEYIKKRYLD